MDVSTILDKLSRLKPNALSESDIVDLINEVETDIGENILNLETYELASIDDKGAELLAPKPYEKIYYDYVVAKIDQINGDTDSYLLTSSQFNETMKEMRKYCIRKGLSPGFGKFENYF